MNTAKMTRQEFLKYTTLGAASLGIASLLSTCRGRDKKPNIVIIMADDMGYSDLGCYGGEIQTPNLDKLAANGLRFTQFYNAARCCPTRASLLTGLYPHQAGMGWMTVRDQKREGYRGDLNDNCITIAELLKQSGYGTYMSGKWHVTLDSKFETPWKTWPRKRGFDRFFGTLNGSGSFFTPPTLMRDETPITEFDKDFYYTDAISDNAAQFVEQHSEKRSNDPFFLYVAYTAPHWPLHAKPEDITKYEKMYLSGWDNLRVDRFERMKAMGIINDEWVLSRREEDVHPWDNVDEEKKKEMAQKMAVYAAMIDSMDQGIGRIVHSLEKTGNLENTLLFFLADNGASHELGIWGFDREPGGVLGAESSFSSYGGSWANASNTPFRKSKTFTHEGGIATPLIVHWPSQIKNKGEFRHQPGHLVDLMATCAEVSGAVYPEIRKKQKIHPMEGKSLVTAFKNGAIKREALYWEHKGNRAIRAGKWKLVASAAEHKDHGDWELYDLERDRTETTNLAETHPELVDKLASMWKSWAKRANVLPLDARGWNEKLAHPKLEI